MFKVKDLDSNIDCSVNLQSSIDTPYYLEGTMEFYMTHEDDQIEKVGHINFLILNPLWNTYASLSYTADLINGDAHSMFSAIEKEAHFDMSNSSSITYLQDIFVEKDYRNMEIGSNMMKEAHLIFPRLGCSIISLISCPREKEEEGEYNYLQSNSRLRKFYEVLGYQMFKTKAAEDGFMYTKLTLHSNISA